MAGVLAARCVIGWTVRDGKGVMRYEYKTEGVYLEEKMIGRTTAASGVVEGIAGQFNKAAAEGWELLQVAMVDVIGKIRKSAERRDVAVAIYRRSVG